MKMPILQPIPIKTKDAIWPVAIWRWLTTIRKWRLVEDFHYEMSYGVEVTIIRGFEFDGASIPRIFWMILSPTGLLLIPGLLHDFAYRENSLMCSVPSMGGTMIVIPFMAGAGRKNWDRMFRNEAIHINGFHIINYVAWISLRLFGWIAWNKLRRAEKEENETIYIGHDH